MERIRSIPCVVSHFWSGCGVPFIQSACLPLILARFLWIGTKYIGVDCSTVHLFCGLQISLTLEVHDHCVFAHPTCSLNTPLSLFSKSARVQRAWVKGAAWVLWLTLYPSEDIPHRIEDMTCQSSAPYKMQIITQPYYHKQNTCNRFSIYSQWKEIKS